MDVVRGRLGPHQWVNSRCPEAGPRTISKRVSDIHFPLISRALVESIPFLGLDYQLSPQNGSHR